MANSEGLVDHCGHNGAGSLRRGWMAGLAMSPRGSFFLRQWLADNVPATSASEILSVAELTQRLFADANALGIRSTEIEEDGSVYEIILDLIERRRAN